MSPPSEHRSKHDLRSRADCQRSSGSFARHRPNSQSSDPGAICLTEGAGRSRIAATTLAGDDPSNARLPVSIS